MPRVKTALIVALFLTTAGNSFAQTAGIGNGSSVAAVNDGGSQAGPAHHRHHHHHGAGAYVSRPDVQALPKDH